MALYIEHNRPFNPPSLRRYEDLPSAAGAISNATHCGFGMVLADLRSRGRFYLGGDWWATITAKEMGERANWAFAAARRMENGEDVSDLPD